MKGINPIIIDKSRDNEFLIILMILFSATPIYVFCYRFLFNLNLTIGDDQWNNAIYYIILIVFTGVFSIFPFISLVFIWWNKQRNLISIFDDRIEIIYYAIPKGRTLIVKFSEIKFANIKLYDSEVTVGCDFKMISGKTIYVGAYFPLDNDLNKVIHENLLNYGVESTIG